MLDAIRLLHTEDEYSWDDIRKIVEHAARVWQPEGMIGSPRSLREWTKKGDRKVHEALLDQARAGKNGTGTEWSIPEGYQLEEGKDGKCRITKQRP